MYQTQFLEQSAMTWMYERISYKRFDPGRFPDLNHDYYSLYFYGEGKKTIIDFMLCLFILLRKIL